MRGEGEYLYQYNYGNLAGDPRTAALNPLHALGTIEPTLEKFRKERTLLEKDVPQLRQIIEGTWRKEADLAALKKGSTPAHDVQPASSPALQIRNTFRKQTVSPDPLPQN